MLDRLMNVLKAAFNKGIKQIETPEILAEQAQSELEGDVRKLKEALTTSLAQEKMLEKQLKKANEELDSWQNRAAVAVSQNNDDVAKQCLTKKQECVQQVQSLETQLSEQKNLTVSLREKSKDVENALREFQRKKADLVTRGKASQAAANATELMSNVSGGGMDKWEQKIQEKEARSEALGELAKESKLKSFAEEADVDDELAALKEQLSGPKLIVDTGSPPEPKDE